MQNQPSFGFGTPVANQSGQPSLFGTPVQPTGLFQNTSSSTTTPSLFGSSTTANPTFGTNTTSAFGATLNATSFGGTPTANPSFGGTPTASSFGSTSTTTPFGSTPAATTFGGTATATPFSVTPTTNSSFFVTPTATPFGVTPTANSFGVSSNANPSFGATPITTLTSTAPFSVGSTPTTTPFGVAASTTPGLGITTSLGGSQQQQQQRPVSGFGVTPGTSLPFGAATTSAAPNFGFGNTTTSASAVPNAGTSFNLGASLTSTPTSNSPSLGLGGQPSTQTKIVTTQKDVTPKDQPLPNEILQTVEAFKELVKQQKLHSSDIARCSVRDFRKVEQDINQLAQLLSEVESQLQKNRQLAEKLKYDTANCLKDVEIAQRTQDTPPGLQYENIAPLKFFLNLADKFERDMQVLKVQIEGADNYVKNYRSPNALTPQDLHIGMRRLHESFVALAGRLHSVHSQVESQKEAYLNTRKQLFNDNSNPFEVMYSPTEDNFKQMINHQPPKVATGPTPFSNLAIGLTQPLGSQQNQSSISYSTPTTSAQGFGNIGFGTAFASQNTSGASNALFGNSSLIQNSNAFQLQKPPTGNKRGKH